MVSVTTDGKDKSVSINYQMLHTKFLQYYDIMEWINAENSVTMPHSKNANGARAKSAEWRPECRSSSNAYFAYIRMLETKADNFTYTRTAM